MTVSTRQPTKPIILVLTGYYLPGYRAGGPIRSIAAIVDALSDEFSFRIITADHDLGEKRPYGSVTPDVWMPVGKAQVMYLSRHGRAPHRVWRHIRDMVYDVIYLNSFFARRFSMFPYALWRLGFLKRTPMILAPRGEFSPGALELKRGVKGAYLAISRALNWYGDDFLLWHASTEYEAQDIDNAVMKSRAPVGAIAARQTGAMRGGERASGYERTAIAGNLPASVGDPPTRAPKQPGALRTVFVSRVSRKKNLDQALRALEGVRGDVTFEVYGPLEDTAYWAECETLISDLPPTIKVGYMGEVPHEEVTQVFTQHDVFLFPTRGENYGHVICEALTAGCPVILSDQTPWRNLHSLGVGWDLPLDDIGAFQTAIQQCVDMDAAEFELFSSRARQYGVERSTDEEAVAQNRRLFRRACEMADPAMRGRGKR